MGLQVPRGIHTEATEEADIRRVASAPGRTGEHFWARGYFVSTVGLDEQMVRAYIRNQEEEDERYDQMKLAMG